MDSCPRNRNRKPLHRRGFLIGPGGQATLAPSSNDPDLNPDEPTNTDGENPNFTPFIDPDDPQRPPDSPPQIPWNFHSVANESPTQIVPILTQGLPSVAFRPGIIGTPTVATSIVRFPPLTTPGSSAVPPAQTSAPTLPASQAPHESPQPTSISLSAVAVSASVIVTTTTSGSIASSTSISIPAAAPSPADSSTSVFNIPVILGIVVASVIAIAVVVATVSWILHMRRKEGFCGCMSSSTKEDDEDEIGKWDYTSTYINATPDLFKEKPESVLDYDRTSASSSRSKEGNWSDVTSKSYPPATPTHHPGVFYPAGSLYGSYGRAPTPIMMQPPYIPPPSIPIHLALDGPYFTTTPRPSFGHPADPFPNPHPPPPPAVDIRTSPVQPTISPGGTLVVANLVPGDMSRPGSTQAAAALPSPPPVCIPQRPWTESFSPHPGHALERLKESKVPLSPLPIPSESLHGTGSEVVPWPPLNVQSKSRSTTSAGGSRSRRSSALSSVAPRLPTPSAMSAVQTESSRSGGGGWAAALKSGIFAALGQMASDAGEDEGDVPPHPDAPLAERLTAVTPRSTRHRRGTRPADLEEGGGAGRMVPVESEESSFALAPSRTNSSVSESKPSRLYKNIKLSQRRHESQIRALNHGKRLGASAGTGIQPARSVSSMYSSTSSSGYTTDIGELEEEGGGAVSHEVLGMYDIGELEEDGGHGTDGKAGVRKIGAVV